MFFPKILEKIKIDSGDDLPLQKTLALHVIKLYMLYTHYISSLKDRNHYYYSIYQEKCSCYLA